MSPSFRLHRFDPRSPVNCFIMRAQVVLPPEVLETVLLYSVRIDPPVFNRDLKMVYPGWMVVLLVCRHWHSASSSCGMAWAEGFTQIPHRLGWVAERTRGLPRRVEFSPDVPAISGWVHLNPSGRRLASYPTGDVMRGAIETALECKALGRIRSLICSEPYNALECASQLMRHMRHVVLEELQSLELVSCWADSQAREWLS